MADPECVHGELPWHCPDCAVTTRAQQINDQPHHQRHAGGFRWSTLFPRDNQWTPSYTECVVGD